MADTPARKSTTIEVPTWLVYVGGCALAVCLLTVGYLIGRDSGRPAVAGDPAPQVTVAPRAEPAALVRAAPPTADARAPTTSPVPAPTRPAAAPAPAIPSPPAPTRRPAPANPQREAVASYFEALDAIGAEGGLSTSDPESLAMAILSQATTGDATAFNKLTAAQQLSLTAIRRVRPPAPAREHHRAHGRPPRGVDPAPVSAEAGATRREHRGAWRAIRAGGTHEEPGRGT